MSSQIRIVKRQNGYGPKRIGKVKSEEQRNREIVGVIKSWIEELRLRGASRSKAALVPLNK